MIRVYVESSGSGIREAAPEKQIMGILREQEAGFGLSVGSRSVFYTGGIVRRPLRALRAYDLGQRKGLGVLGPFGEWWTAVWL